MPLPRYQPLKRLKTSGLTINDLDDACLSKILGYVLEFSNLRDDHSTVGGDNGKTERNLSLVSKRWYFLTQTQVADRGVHRINLDSLIKQITTERAKPPKTTIIKNCIQAPGRTVASTTITGRPVLSIRNYQNTNRTTTRTDPTTVLNDKIQSINDYYNIDIFLRLQPRLYKYKHILFEGNLPTDEFKKLVVVLDAARTERLSFDILVEKRLSLIKDSISLPSKLRHLEKLTLHWNVDRKSSHTNELTWRVYKRATNLRCLELHARATNTSTLDDKPFNIAQSEVHHQDPIISPLYHHNLERLVFTWSPNEPGIDCPVLPLIKDILQSESSVTEVETNDPAFIEYLIGSSNRVCTTHRLKNLKLSSPLHDLNLLTKLLESNNLGTERLSILIDDIELLNEVCLGIENFKLCRPSNAQCRLMISFKDQKFADSEDKIKTMVQLSRMANLVVNIESQQRISIDCCHLMWSIGRALQANNTKTQLSSITNEHVTGKCLFKITITAVNPNKYTEVTVPFGQCRNYSIDSTREDLNRHREIMKSLKKDCYHQFVKSVRGNLTP